MTMLAAFIRRDWAIARSYRLPFLLDLAGIVFSLFLFFFLGKLVGDSEVAREMSRGYFAFVVIGVAVLGVVQVSLSGIAERIRSEQTAGTIEALLASSAPLWRVVAFGNAYDLLYAAGESLIMLTVAVLAFGARFSVELEGLIGAVLGAALTLALCAGIGMLVAAFTIVFKKASALTQVLNTALALLGGVYFPVSLMPKPLGLLATINPLRWGLDSIRAGLIDGKFDGINLALLAVAVAVGAPVSSLVLRQAVRRAKRTGTLAHY